MFLNISEVTKEIKRYYKSFGIKIGDIRDGIILFSGNWLIWMDREYVPNKVKACIVELMGKLPEEGIIYDVMKDCSEPQVFEQSIIEPYLLLRNKIAHKLITTPIIFDKRGSVRFLQSIDTGKLTGISEKFLKMIDASAIDHAIESDPTGPCYANSPEEGLMWYNDWGFVLIMPVHVKEIGLLTALEALDFDNLEIEDEENE